MSGMKISSNKTLPKMKKNPIRVTIFGASHSGNNSTNAVHYLPHNLYQYVAFQSSRRSRTYVVGKDITRDEGFVDTGVFVGFQMHECLFRDALNGGFACSSTKVSCRVCMWAIAIEWDGRF